MNFKIILSLFTTIISLAIAQGSGKEFTYVAGQNATIKCPQYDKSYKFIWLMFTKEKIIHKIYTIDYRSRKRKQFPNKEYEKRLQFRTRNNIEYFVLLNVKAEDEGSFECRILPTNGEQAVHKSILHIIVPPTNIIIKDSKGVQVAGLAGPYDEKETIDLICEASDGKPAPNITWYKNGISIKANNELSEDKVKSMIKVGPLRKNHTKYSYYCEATNHINAVIRSNTLNLDINTLPTMLKFVGNEEPLISNISYQIECLVQGSKPPAEITWKLDERTLLNHSEYIKNVNKAAVVSRLTFTPNVLDGGKTLKCFAKNPSIVHKPLETSRILSIYYKPNVTLTFFPKSSVDEGDPVRLDCKVKANPSPYEVSFFKGHDKLYNIDNYMTISNRSVSIIKTNRKSSGSYSCVARNQVGIGSANPESLRVKHEPQCKSRTNVVGASRQETVNVICAVDSWPPVTHFHWQFNQTGKITYMNSNYTSDEFTSTIKYTPRFDTDFGSLLCWAKNSYGEMKEPCVYSVVKAEIPDRLENCTQVNRTSETLFVACISGKDGGLPQKFVGELFDTTQDMHVHNVTSIEPQFHLEELNPGTMYFLTLYSQNSKGHSEKVLLQLNTSSIADRPGLAIPAFHGFPLTPVLSILIGVVGVLILVALITAGIMHQRRDDKNKPKTSQVKHTPLQSDDSEKFRSDSSGMPNKLKTPNLYDASPTDKSNEQKGQKRDYSDDVVYADLELASSGKKGKKQKEKKSKKASSAKKNKDEKNIYSSIDYNKSNMKNDGSGKNGKSTSKSPPPPKELVATEKDMTQVFSKRESPHPKSILSKKNEKPPLPFKPSNLQIPSNFKDTKEVQTSDDEEVHNRESAPLMPTLESNL